MEKNNEEKIMKNKNWTVERIVAVMEAGLVAKIDDNGFVVTCDFEKAARFYLPEALRVIERIEQHGFKAVQVKVNMADLKKHDYIF
jgi:MoaA/NifB/PqqE/SkfB family radical SAM enzyme